MTINQMQTSNGIPAKWPIQHHYVCEESNSQHYILAETWACAQDKLKVCGEEHYMYLSSTDATGSYVYDAIN